MENEEISLNNLKDLIVQLNTDLRGEFTGLKEEVTGLKGEFTGLKGEFTGLKEDVTGLKGEFTGLKEEVLNLNVRLSRIESKVDTLEEQSFNKQEKNDILTTVRQYNQRFEHEVLGKDDITLHRTEYDATSEKVGFINRFKEREITSN